MRGGVSAALLGLVVMAGCLQGPGGEALPTSSAAPPPPLRFLAVGDMGTGGSAQAQVAQAMARVCAERGCSFVLGLGDLIYPSGASSPDDPQFDSKFERPYAGLNRTFWMALGNHDNGGEPAHVVAAGGLASWHERGDNAVAYHYRTDRASDMWHLPARFYGFSEGPADFLALDTNTLLFHGMDVPPDLNASMEEQERWLTGAVAAGNGTWKVAFGHHPYVSNGPHGDAGAYDGRPGSGQGGGHLKAVVERELCGKVDVYLAGHDHNLQWLEPVPSCGATHFIVSGGGGAGTYPVEGNRSAVFQRQSHGFWWIELSADGLRAAAYDQDATLLHESAVPKPVP